MSTLSAAAKKLLDEQVGEWKLLRDNIAALDRVETRSIDLGEFALNMVSTHWEQVFTDFAGHICPRSSSSPTPGASGFGGRLAQ